MASPLQLRQRSLYQAKGTIGMTEMNLRWLVYNKYLTMPLRDKIATALKMMEKARIDFNSEVGWKEESYNG